MRRDYELGFILNPEVSEEQIQAIQSRIEQIVVNYGGQTVKVNQWGRRRLAYPIAHNRDGFYVFIDMILTPETVKELDRSLKVSEEVLRHMIRRRDPKAVQKEREGRAAAAAVSIASIAPRAFTEPESAEEAHVPVDGDEGVELSSALSVEDLEDTPPAIAEDIEVAPPAIEEEEIEV